MFTIVITKDTFGSAPKMYSYTSREGAIQMATLGYKEDVLVFNPENVLIAQVVEGNLV